MLKSFSFRLIEFLITAALAVAIVAAWRADRRDTAKLTADLAAAKQSLTEATTRQHDRDAQLLQTLAALAAEKRTITTPTQILRDLPKQIPLPSPITLQSEAPSSNPQTVDCSAGRSPRSPAGLDCPLTPTNPSNNAAATQAAIPAADLKPLYDFAIDCKTCQAKLTTAQADLTDERAKTTVLTHERDEAVHAAKGGSVLRRIARNAKWLAIGALAGAVAAKTHR